MKTKIISAFENCVWHGTNDPNIPCKVMHCSRPGGGKPIKVYVWQSDKAFQFQFTICAGHDSDFSYTGLCVNCYNMGDAVSFVIAKNEKGSLIK